MPPFDNEARARAKAESSAHIAEARISNKQSRDHVDASRTAIARSLRLLAKPFHRAFGGQ